MSFYTHRALPLFYALMLCFPVPDPPSPPYHQTSACRRDQADTRLHQSPRPTKSDTD